MKFVKVVMLSILISGLAFSVAAAKSNPKDSPGKALFNDPKFAGGSVSCNECHPNGKGLEKAAGKKKFNIKGRTASSLEEAINLCIETGNKGKPIDLKSPQMVDLVSYLRTFWFNPNIFY